MSKKPAILTIDTGLTNVKVNLFDLEGQVACQESQRYPTIIKKPNWSEQTPDAWWKAIRKCIHKMLVNPAMSAREVICISVTAHMHGMVAVDSTGNALTNCWTLYDRRATVEAGNLNRLIGPRTAYNLTGGRLEPYTPAAKILWLKENDRERYNKTACFLSPKDMVRIQLGGDLVTDPIDSAGTLLYDLRKRDWSDVILTAMNLPRHKLPEIRQSFESAGTLSAEAGSQLGLSPGIPLVTGAGDDVEALGAGVIRPGQALEHIGTTGTMITCLTSPIFDPNQVIEVYPHAFPGRYLLGGATNAAGRSLDWACRLLFFRHFKELPLEYPPTKDAIDPPIYLPYISGERGVLWETNATGSFIGLRDIHHATDLARAVYYGVAFSMKEFQIGADRLGAAPHEIISGTPIGNRAWSQLRADIYGLPLLFPDSSYPTGLGAAILAMVNQNIFTNIESAVQKCCHVSQRVKPDPARRNYFDKCFEHYQDAIVIARSFFKDPAKY